MCTSCRRRGRGARAGRLQHTAGRSGGRQINGQSQYSALTAVLQIVIFAKVAGYCCAVAWGSAQPGIMAVLLNASRRCWMADREIGGPMAGWIVKSAQTGMSVLLEVVAQRRFGDAWMIISRAGF